MKLREAQTADLPTLLEFEQCVVEEERPCNAQIRASDVKYYDLDQLIADPEASLQVVEHEGQMVACGYVQIRSSNAAFTHARHGYMGFMYVVPGARGRGVNKLVVDSLIAWGKEQGVFNFYLDVYAENQPAIRAYEKAGFISTLIEMKLNFDDS